MEQIVTKTQSELEQEGWAFSDEYVETNQDKTVDVTENGTIEVTPDEGFTGLGKVTVNTNVESGGGSNWRYFDRTKKEPTNEVGVQLALFTLFKQIGVIMPMSYAVAINGREFYEQATCIAIDLNMPFRVSGAPISTLGEFLTLNDMDLDTIVASFNYTEITEEEFYNLD